MKELCCVVLLSLALFSCERDEIALTLPPTDTSIRTTQLRMGDDYRYRLYYNLESDSVVAYHRKKEWDLAFECSAEGRRIALNSSKYMSIYKTGSFEFESTVNQGNDGPHFDVVGEFLDSTALGDWQEGEVFIIDRGVDADGTIYPLHKVQIHSVDEEKFTYTHGLLSSSTGQLETIYKLSNRNLALLSFEEEVAEPPNDTWDLLFTQYTRYFDFYLGQDSVQYLVSGALLNPNSVRAARPLEEGFGSVESLDEALQLSYSTRQETVGWDWKEFDLNTGLYSIQPNYFVVQSINEQYYRLEFTGFYNSDGEKGAPLFESALLQ